MRHEIHHLGVAESGILELVVNGVTNLCGKLSAGISQRKVHRRHNGKPSACITANRQTNIGNIIDHAVITVLCLC